MHQKKQLFKNACDRFVSIYKEVLGKDISVEDIVDQDKFRQIYHELARASHPDINDISYEVMAEINGLKLQIDEFFDDPEFVNSGVVAKTVLRNYSEEVLGRLKSKSGEYQEISKEFEQALIDFEVMVLFEKTKAGITGLYYYYTKELDELLKKTRYIKTQTEYLRGFVDYRNQENVELFYEFMDKLSSCNSIGDIAELCKTYEIIIKKNALSFLAKDSLSSLCAGYQDEELNRYIEEASNKVRLIDGFNEDEFMKVYIVYSNKIGIRRKKLECYDSLDKLMKSCINASYDGIYIGEILNCDSIDSIEIVYNQLKEIINNRIDYSKRISAKIMGFLNKCKRNPENSYTYPFIFERANRLFGYYDPMDKDLSKFEELLGQLEKQIERQREVDLEKAANKKDALRNKFNTDFSEGIFLADGKSFFEYGLDSIETFGGFANYENKTIRVELPRIVADVYNYLVNIQERLVIEKNISDKKDRLAFIRKAVDYVQIFAKICKSTNDFYSIKLSNSAVVDYRIFSRMIQTLKNIDYVNSSIDKLTDEFSIFEEFLYGEDYDSELENVVNRKR